MSTKVGQVFTFSLPGGRLAPLYPRQHPLLFNETKETDILVFEIRNNDVVCLNACFIEIY